MINLLRRCFVIGPMQDMARLRQLVDLVIRPLLEPYGYSVTTPDHADIGLVMNQVLLSLEQADLLIADLTGNNPNVLYELGIYHAFGKPYIALREETGQPAFDKTPFDVAAHRYVVVDLRDIDAAQAVLRDFLTRTQLIDQIGKVDYFSNPVTDFYLSPIAEIPTAIGLAKNYTKNFIEPLIPALFRPVTNTQFYAIDVQIEMPPEPG